MIIAYVCDDVKYLPFIKISMASIRRYNKEVEFIVLSDSPFEIDGAKVFTFLPDYDKFKFKAKDRMKGGVYYKFYLPKLPYDKILYIDTDIVCQRPLNELWQKKCSFICATESHAFGKEQAKMLSLKRYALTGMMLMNLKALRKANFTDKCLNFLDSLAKDKTQKLFWHDETVINSLFNDRIDFIEEKYNFCRNRIYENAELKESDAYLLHYIGKQKKDMLKLNNFNNLNAVKELLKGKSIALVGNSESILTKEQGAEIDNHDIVIRFNKGYPSRKPEALGQRTDLLFLACTLSDYELKQFNAKYLIRRSRLCQNICDYKISTSDRTSLKQILAQASTGFIAINFVLSSDYKKLDLYGFDFFKKATYYNPKGYQPLHNGNAEEEKVLEYEKAGLLKIK